MISPARRRIVFNAIKNAILKGQEVEYWTLRVYDQQAAGVLTDEQVAELEALIEAHYNPPVSASDPAESEQADEPEEVSTEPESEPSEAPEQAETDLSAMTKAELLEYAQEHGVEVYESWTKAEIIAAIEAA